MESIKPRLLVPFSNPFLITELPYEENFRNDLINECLKIKNQQDTVNSVVAKQQVGFQSQKILFKTQEPCLKRISEFIHDSIKTISKFIAPKIDFDTFNAVCSGWININQKGSLHFPHTHGNTTFAGVFYVKIPKATKTTNDNNLIKPGYIEFLDPRNDVSGQIIKLYKSSELLFTLFDKFKRLS